MVQTRQGTRTDPAPGSAHPNALRSIEHAMNDSGVSLEDLNTYFNNRARTSSPSGMKHLITAILMMMNSFLVVVGFTTPFVYMFGIAMFAHALVSEIILYYLPMRKVVKVKPFKIALPFILIFVWKGSLDLAEEMVIKNKF